MPRRFMSSSSGRGKPDGITATPRSFQDFGQGPRAWPLSVPCAAVNDDGAIDPQRGVKLHQVIIRAVLGGSCAVR
jgi:hypothetical protein